MKRIQEIDRNMAVSTRVEDPDIIWMDVHDAPFSLHGFGVAEKGDLFRRVPADVAEATSTGVAALAVHTAGGRVRFATDSDCVAAHVEISHYSPMDHMTCAGIFGFDVYVDVDGKESFVGNFRGSFRPDLTSGGYESKVKLPGKGMRQVTINFPLYNQVDNLLIGVREGSRVEAPRAYSYPVPVVYYGSSTTQGGCASRPGNSYQAIISRMLDCDYVNLGFSGSAKGEDEIIRYIAGLKMSVFVSDYYYNAPDPAHLRATHERMYRTIRAAQPDLPIVIVSRRDKGDPDTHERCEIVWETYQKALAEGDRNITFVPGEKLFEGPMWTDCTVDGTHPNDLGFMRMAQAIGPAVKQMLQLAKEE